MTATVPALVLLALAVVVWPATPAPTRLRALDAARTSGSGNRRRPPVAILAGVGALAVVAVAGPGGAVAAVVVGVVLLRAHRARRWERETTAAVAGLAEGLAAFAAELRAGHPPAAAAAAAGAGAHPACARALALVEATARLGGDVPASLRDQAGRDTATGPHVRRLADAWSLAERHGIGLAGLAAAVADDLRARSRFGGRLAAQLAGPRTTSAVLAGLPVIGLGLGELMGAHPWAVLTGTGLGQVLLVVGALFVGAGLEWSGHLTAQVVR